MDSTHNYGNYFDGRSVLVTGGYGFIGSHLTQHLTDLRASVHVLDDLSSGYSANLAGLDVQCWEGSILDTGVMKEAIQGCSVVFHEAAFVSVPNSFEHAEECFEVNIKGTSNVLQAATKAGCARVVFASSAACYGSTPCVPSRETDPVSAESPYAQSKVMGEQLMRDAKVDTASLRYFNVFGKRQDPNSQYAAVVASFARALCISKIPTIFGDGLQTRDFTPVENIVHANLLAGSHGAPLNGEIFNVGTGNAISLIALIQFMTGQEEIHVEHAMGRVGDVQSSCADIAKITKELGFEEVVQTALALRAMLNPKPC